MITNSKSLSVISLQPDVVYFILLQLDDIVQVLNIKGFHQQVENKMKSESLCMRGVQFFLS